MTLLYRELHGTGMLGLQGILQEGCSPQESSIGNPPA